MISVDVDRDGYRIIIEDATWVAGEPTLKVIFNSQPIQTGKVAFETAVKQWLQSHGYIILDVAKALRVEVVR